MKSRILLAAVIGAGIEVIFYPTTNVADRLTVLAVSFLLLVGILFCTMLIGAQDTTGKSEQRDQVPAAGEKKTEKV